ncbi:MAG: thioredoxin family protein [Tannerella sp.]|nr:thioredoxin family protein [Tannerella sp.]
MRSVLCFIFIGLMLQPVSMETKAQKTAVYEGLTYYLDKTEAFEAATAEGKMVFLFWGSVDCSRCNNVKKNLAAESLRSLLDDHYILWYSDVSEYDRNAPEVVDYLSAVSDPYIPYPALCIIDMSDITKAYGLIWGKQLAVYQLYAMLNKYVANDNISDPKDLNRAYVSQNNLVVEGDAANEEISVYAVTGSLVDRFRRTEQRLTHDASSYPSGILVVTGSSGWTRKVAVRK